MRCQRNLLNSCLLSQLVIGILVTGKLVEGSFLRQLSVSCYWLLGLFSRPPSLSQKSCSDCQLCTADLYSTAEQHCLLRFCQLFYHIGHIAVLRFSGHIALRLRLVIGVLVISIFLTTTSLSKEEQYCLLVNRQFANLHLFPSSNHQIFKSPNQSLAAAFAALVSSTNSSPSN